MSAKMQDKFMGTASLLSAIDSKWLKCAFFPWGSCKRTVRGVALGRDQSRMACPAIHAPARCRLELPFPPTLVSSINLAQCTTVHSFYMCPCTSGLYATHRYCVPLPCHFIPCPLFLKRRVRQSISSVKPQMQYFCAARCLFCPESIATSFDCAGSRQA